MMETSRIREKLVIVSHVVHYRSAGQIHAYAPYVREIEIWADLFEQVLIAAPCREQEPPGDCARLDRHNLRIAPQREAGGETLTAKIKLLASLPGMTWDLCRALRHGDAIQVRCPGNLGLLGAVFAPLFSKHRIAKFAGQWDSNPGDPFSVRFQRFVLRSRWWSAPVTVYGNWPHEPAHIVPFFNSALTADQIARAQATAAKRGPDELRHVLYVGRLSRAKNIDVLLKALASVRNEGFPFTATIAGEGPELFALQRLCADLKLNDRVKFTGGVGFSRIVELLERSGILVLASDTEGWPKAIVEAMAFGLVAIGSQIGLVPRILGEGRGLTVPPRDVEVLATALRNVLRSPDRYSAMRERASAWAGHYSIESLRDSLRLLVADRWGLHLEDQSKTKSNPIAPAVCVHE
ncbi:MAG TPA: glycosyltransferase [Candidatus Acidoferrales bacterium]|nr:glycosyltransferase [Candidatus Acidoferrales bacterium]